MIEGAIKTKRNLSLKRNQHKNLFPCPSDLCRDKLATIRQNKTGKVGRKIGFLTIFSQNQEFFVLALIWITDQLDGPTLAILADYGLFIDLGKSKMDKTKCKKLDKN